MVSLLYLARLFALSLTATVASCFRSRVGGVDSQECLDRVPPRWNRCAWPGPSLALAIADLSLEQSMLPEAEGGVVDTSLRVYGVTGLRVVDSSMVPVG